MAAELIGGVEKRQILIEDYNPTWPAKFEVHRSTIASRVREPDWNEHRMLRTPQRDVHVHVYSEGCAEIGRNVRFRDRLRAHAQDRKRYEHMKRSLAQLDWPDMNAYAAAKTEVIESILAAAPVSDRSRRPRSRVMHPCAW